jgi:sRNA-binding protein
MSTDEQDEGYAKRKLEEAEKKIAATRNEEKAHWMRQAEEWGKTVRAMMPTAGNDFVTRALGT